MVKPRGKALGGSTGGRSGAAPVIAGYSNFSACCPAITIATIAFPAADSGVALISMQGTDAYIPYVGVWASRGEQANMTRTAGQSAYLETGYAKKPQVASREHWFVKAARRSWVSLIAVRPASQPRERSLSRFKLHLPQENAYPLDNFEPPLQPNTRGKHVGILVSSYVGHVQVSYQK